MPSEGVPEPSAVDALQFDHAEFTTDVPGPVVCGSCARPIADVYYETGGKVLCETCVRAIQSHIQGGSRGLRFFKAVGFGFLAAIGGAIIIYLFRTMTGYEAGLISILAGFMVGSAVRQGTGHRGGRVYQFLALFLTYSALSWSYVPDIVGFITKARNESAAKNDPPAHANAPGANPTLVGEKIPDPAPDMVATAPGENVPALKKDAAAPDADANLKEGLHEAVYIVIVSVMSVVFAYGFPVIMIVSELPKSLISLLILFWGLQQAWQLTRKISIDFRGPFRVGGKGPSMPEVPAHA